MNKLQKYAIGIAFIIIGLSIVGNKLYRIKKTKDTEKWPNISADLLEINKRDERREGSNISYCIDVKYEYTINNESYTNDRYFRKGPFHSGIKSNRDDVYNELSNRENISVYYNPEDPSESFVSVTSKEDIGAGLVLGGVFAFFGFIALFLKPPRSQTTFNIPK